ncbi:FAD-dependent oxidoreductase [Propionispira raffinosivorans]|uniref:FAD-dependent oxidoreductase n=1 Tax=Propionispira raffinosivorans TaxID=86959 RepID=UPI00036ADE4D|nr:FAD-dependent oxidoreductase [Propionispira raffinosivorans]
MGEKQNVLEKKTSKHAVSRRTFLKDSVMLAGGVLSSGLLLTGCNENPKDYLKKPTAENPEIFNDWLGKSPEIPDSKIKKILNTDIIVVGAGVAGLNAARAASENGAEVLVIEKAGTWQCRSGQYGTLNNKIQRSLGITFEKNTAILENMKQMGYRADQRIWNYWADHSGEDFDWLLELAPDLAVLPETATQLAEGKINLLLMHYPVPASYNRSEENSPTYPTVMSFLPDQKSILERVFKKDQEQGCEFLFETKVCQLLRPDDQSRVEGVICEDIKGNYIKINAKKAVILATGDYSNNKSMVKALMPWAVDYVNVFPNKDAKGKPTNTGDGHIMGAWIGGKIEDGPHAPVVHTLGGPMGTDAYMLANDCGKRFVNEDIGGQQLSCSLYRQPGNFAWQIFDDKWPEQLEFMGVGHGSVNHCLPVDQNPKLPKICAWSLGRTAYTSREDFLKTQDLIIAQSMDELVSKIFPENKEYQENLKKTIARYNESANKGNDEEFGKLAKRMFPIATPPFYAGKMPAGIMLFAGGGFTINPENCNVLDKNYDSIPGLYAAGNVQGGRFVGDYPVVTAGVSHAMALGFGRLAGASAAKL